MLTMNNGEQIFILDDSQSVQSSARGGWSLFAAIVYFIGNPHRDIDLYFASQQPPECVSNMSAKELIDRVYKRWKSGLESTMNEKCMTGIVDKIKTRLASKGDHPGATIYIFTDGVWERGDGNGDEGGLAEGLVSLGSLPGASHVTVRVVLFPAQPSNDIVENLVRSINEVKPENL